MQITDFISDEGLQLGEVPEHTQLALRELVPLGVTGAIIGTALYVGNFTLADALDVAQG